MARELEQRSVKISVRVRRPEEVALPEEGALARQAFLQPLDPRLVDPLRRLPDREPLEDRSCLQDLDRFLVRDLPDACAPVRLADMSNVVLTSASTRRALGAMSPRTMAARRAS